MSARAVEATGSAFSPRGDALSDAGIALDEILSMTGNVEPVVLRVAATGGSRRQRELVSGDWLCVDHETPRRIPRPSWSYDGASVVWSRRRQWLEAWETCEEPQWMVNEAIHKIRTGPRPIVAVACAAARSCAHLIDSAVTVRSIMAAERWASTGDGSHLRLRLEDDVRASDIADTTADPAGADAAWSAHCAFTSAAQAAAAASDHEASVVAGSQAINAAICAAYALASSEVSSSLPDYDSLYDLHYRSISGIVREHITALDVLRLVAERGKARP